MNGTWIHPLQLVGGQSCCTLWCIFLTQFFSLINLIFYVLSDFKLCLRRVQMQFILVYYASICHENFCGHFSE